MNWVRTMRNLRDAGAKLTRLGEQLANTPVPDDTCDWCGGPGAEFHEEHRRWLHLDPCCADYEADRAASRVDAADDILDAL